MTTATALCASVLCLCPCAPAGETAAPPVFACNLRAISAAARPRYNALVNRIRAAIRDRNEIAVGYVFHLDSKALTLPEVAEWVSMERLCCPFLTLQLTASGNQAGWILTLTGPAGVKPLIRTEFPAT